MGQSMSWVSSLLWAKKEIRILILGLVRSTPLRARACAAHLDNDRTTI
jgi:ADP-ribosylation factor-like protein 1